MSAMKRKRSAKLFPKRNDRRVCFSLFLIVFVVFGLIVSSSVCLAKKNEKNTNSNGVDDNAVRNDNNKMDTSVIELNPNYINSIDTSVIEQNPNYMDNLKDKLNKMKKNYKKNTNVDKENNDEEDNKEEKNIEQKEEEIEDHDDYDDDDDDYETEEEYDDAYDEEGDDEEEEDEVETKSDTKTMIGKALEGTRTSKRRAVAILKKHQFRIYILVAIVAFHREILNFVWNQIIAVPVKDKKTGKVIRRIKIRPTTILKLVLLLDLARKIGGRGQKRNTTVTTNDNQQEEESDGTSNESHMRRNSPLRTALLLASLKNPFLGGLLSNLLLPHPHANSAYIPPIEQHFTFERINDRYIKDAMALEKAIQLTGKGLEPSSSGSLPSSPFFSARSNQQKEMIQSLPSSSSSSSYIRKESYNGTVVILDLTGEDAAIAGTSGGGGPTSTTSRFNVLRDEVSFLISHHRRTAMKKNSHRLHHTSTDTISTSENTTSNNNQLQNQEQQYPQLEVLVLLNSPGGGAQDFALAAQQLLRLRNEPGITVTVCVDKIAASGGYMIACTASPGKLLAAPFAVVGSIGVIGQAVNVHKALMNWGITPLVFRAGKEKAPLGLIGEITQKDKDSVQSMVNTVHTAFQRHVIHCRPQKIGDHNIRKLATGEIWLGYDAVDLGLTDRCVTSDEYIHERLHNDQACIFKLLKYQKKQLRFPSFYQMMSNGDGIGVAVNGIAETIIRTLMGQLLAEDTATGQSLLQTIQTAASSSTAMTSSRTTTTTSATQWQAAGDVLSKLSQEENIIEWKDSSSLSVPLRAFGVENIQTSSPIASSTKIKTSSF